MNVGDRAAEESAFHRKAGGQAPDLEQRLRLLARRRARGFRARPVFQPAHGRGRRAPPHLAELGRRGEQHARIFGARIVEDLLDRTLLDHLAAVHDDHAIGHLRNDRHVMGHEQHRHSVFALQAVDERQNLGLDRHVQRGRRLVGDEEARLARHRHRDHDALAHAAREFVRILFEAPLRLRNANAFEELDRPRPRLFPAQSAMDPETVDELPLDGEDRIERRHRLLKDHPDLTAAQLAQEFGRRRGEVDRLAAVRREFEPPRRQFGPPPNSTRRMSESDVTDLPDPDLPTTHTVSPGSIVNETSSTAMIVPPSVLNSTRRFSTATSGC